MSIENVTTALQVNATTGNGLTVTLPGPRFLTFKVQGNGNVTAGAVAIDLGQGQRERWSGQGSRPCNQASPGDCNVRQSE